MAKKEPLWISAVAFKTGGHNSRCIRSWLTRRLRLSFAESLRKNGYAHDGTPLVDNKEPKMLFGTVQLISEPEMLNMAPDIVQHQTDKAVEEIIRLQGRQKGEWKGTKPWQSSTKLPTKKRSDKSGEQ